MGKSKQVKKIPLDRDIEQLIICAERYCVGRQTYIVSVFISTVTPLLPSLSDWCLTIINNDLLATERMGLDNRWGADCDRREWGIFWNAVLDEITYRIAIKTWKQGETKI